MAEALPTLRPLWMQFVETSPRNDLSFKWQTSVFKRVSTSTSLSAVDLI
jgi:hypothetical protein